MSNEGKIKAELNLPNKMADTTRVPIEVRDARGIVRQRGLVGDSLALPPGRYFVTAKTPEGLEWSSPDAVELSGDDEKSVELYADPVEELPDTAADPAGGGEADEPSVDGAAQLRSVSVIRCARWLEHWMQQQNGLTAGSVVRQEVPSDGLLRDDGESDFLIEVVSSRGSAGEAREQAAYFAVPFDSTQPTHVRLLYERSGVPDVTFAFADPAINDFLTRVKHGDVGNSKSVAQSYAPETASLRNQSRKPLTQLIAAYVLLRCADDKAKLDQLDVWSRDLLAEHGDALPDALPLRVEILARLGRHREIIDLGVASVRFPRLPWFRSGIGYLAQRIDQHLQVVKGSSQKMAMLSQDQLNAYTMLAQGLDRLTWSIDDTRTTSVFRSLQKLA